MRGRKLDGKKMHVVVMGTQMTAEKKENGKTKEKSIKPERSHEDIEEVEYSGCVVLKGRILLREYLTPQKGI